MTRQCQPLQVGQTVQVQEQEVCYRITVVAADQPGSKIVEKGEDYIVLDDASGEVRTRIPMHLIGSVVAPAEPAAVAA
jgi:hypothetical protein